MAAPATCISCNKPFAENRELAAIPDASKVAFDPAYRRVWRICAGCGEWNLLGAEAAAAALPELEARFAAVTSSSAPELGFAPARVSSRLELLRVGRADLIAQDDATAMRLRKEVDKRAKAMRMAKIGGVVGTAAWLLFTALYTHGRYGFVPLMVFLYGSVYAIQQTLRAIRGVKVPAKSFLLSYGAVLSATAYLLITHQQEHLRYQLVGLLFTGPMLIGFDLYYARVGLVAIHLPDGSRLRLPDVAVPRVTLGWDAGNTNLSIHDLPKGRSLAGPDVFPAFRVVASAASKPGAGYISVNLNAISENAYNLLTTVGGLAGLLRALEGFRRDSDGRVLIAELPAVYLVALDLALSDKGAGSDAGALREKAIEAAAVADEAEELDRR